MSLSAPHDIYVRHTDKSGASHVQTHRVWNACLFMQARDDEAKKEGGNPLMIMQNLHIIEGRPSWSSQFIIAAINNCGKFSPLRFDLEWLDEMDATYSTYEWVNRQKVEKKHTVRIKNARCVAWAIEKATGERLESAPVTMEMAVNEGWYGKNGSKWRSMPDLMLRYRSAAFFGRIYAPELLMGLPTAEEVQDVFVQEPDGTLVHAGAGPQVCDQHKALQPPGHQDAAERSCVGWQKNPHNAQKKSRLKAAATIKI